MIRHVNEKEYKNKINIFSGDTLLVNTQESVLTVCDKPYHTNKGKIQQGEDIKVYKILNFIGDTACNIAKK